MSWLNNDGLLVKTGFEGGTSIKGGHVHIGSAQSILEFQLSLTPLTTTGTIVGNGTIDASTNGFVLPRGARIESVEIINDVAATSGGSATLNIGVMALDRSTQTDDDGLVAALALASFNAVGETALLTAGSTGAGALVGTVLASAGIVTAKYATAAFTAGQVTVRVHYTMSKL